MENKKFFYEKNIQKTLSSNELVSVGIFEIISRQRRKVITRKISSVRIWGNCSDTEKIYNKADEIIKQLEDGSYSGKKSIKI